MIGRYGRFGDWLDVQEWLTGGGLVGSAIRSARTDAAPSTDAKELYRRASAMVEAAEDRKSLTDYRSAEGSNYFYYSPYNDTTAYLQSAYWLGVAVRVGASSSLLSDAKSNLRKGYALWSAPGGSQATAKTSTIPKEAAAKIMAAGGSQVPGIRAVATILDASSSAGAIANRQEQVYNVSVEGAVIDPIVQTAKDLAQLPKDPWSVLKDLPWWSWAILGGVVLMPVLAAVIQGRSLRRVARAALPGPVANPRRRYRRRRRVHADR